MFGTLKLSQTENYKLGFLFTGYTILENRIRKIDSIKFIILINTNMKITQIK